MKNRCFILFVLIGLICTATQTYAQRVHIRGGVHFSHGFGPRYYGPRVIAPYHVYRGPVFHGYYRPWYRPYYGVSLFFPPIGFYVSTLPYGYFALGPTFGPVFYSGGTYYRQYNKGYKVVDPPMDAAVPNLPDGAREINVDGSTYYELNGTYYQEIMTDNGRRYKVVGKNGKIGNATVHDQNTTQPEDLITALPEGCRSVEINGQQYFLSPDGMYYQQVNNGNTSGYKIVGKISADN
ncbi:MAG TPA: DUF6515 family protein [Chitinophaga sp.]|uniref:DUF6515 family protein n=1 Tax=Chitinophaga sp. TaxID=1869181 RepID=UPI002BD9D34C|nr:DUF6515 family protein [Chitinophaga sp.]HVI46763.1 DUF6515 family protein [Chitinophaga sp.]